jgi:UDPglucose 6-dehydrogenase
MIYVVGVGFVGLTTALGFAKKKFIVTAVENNKKKIKLLIQNKITFDEPFLKENLKIFLKKKKIILSHQLSLQKKEDNYVFICVGTPEKKNGEVNLKSIKKIILEIDSKFYQCNVLIIIKSTVPPGTITDHLNKIIKHKKNIRIVSNPEFLREGFAWNDFINANKIVIGAEEKKDQLKIKKLYQKFKGEIILTNTKTAEFIKYLSNCLLANLISFSNEMTIFAEKIKDIKIFQSFNSIKLDQRWFGNPANIASYLHPGIGFGGYCLPKDLKAINYLAKKKRIPAKLLGSIQDVNKKIFLHQLKKIDTTINKRQKI